MNTYEQQAQDFLNATGAKLTITYKERAVYFAGNKDLRDVYKFTLSRNGKSYRATFGQSIANTGKAPTAYDILACLQPNEAETVDALISDYGYEVNSAADYRKLEKMARDLKRQNAGLARLFTSAELDQLSEIN